MAILNNKGNKVKIGTSTRVHLVNFLWINRGGISLEFDLKLEKMKSKRGVELYKRQNQIIISSLN